MSPFKNTPNFINQTANFILSLIFPPLCLYCRKLLQNPRHLLCPICLSHIKINRSLLSLKTHNLLNKSLPENNNENIFSRPQSSLVFGSATHFHNPILKVLIHYAKFKNSPHCARLLGHLLTAYVLNLLSEEKLLIPKDSVIIPIPVSLRRRLKRGYNQTEIIARYLANKLALPFEARLLLRLRHTPSQSTISDFKKRQQNVAACFSLANPTVLKNKSIILIDDVLTTGATARSAIKTLRSAYPKQIILLTVAHT